MTVDLVRCR